MKMRNKVALCIIGITIAAVLIGCACSSTKVTAKQVIIRERVSNSDRVEVWQECLYSLDTIRYDTIRRYGWDTAHELPR